MLMQLSETAQSHTTKPIWLPTEFLANQIRTPDIRYKIRIKFLENLPPSQIHPSKIQFDTN